MWKYSCRRLIAGDNLYNIVSKMLKGSPATHDPKLKKEGVPLYNYGKGNCGKIVVKGKL